MTEPIAPEPAGSTVVADEAGYTYWAFISYSHADEGWARWLHRSLETYKVPKPIVGTPGPGGGPLRPARLFPLFRDREELSTASSLGGRIQGALAASRNLIVICSPNAVGSRWVNEEIRTFKALGREGRVFCLIVDGEPNAGDRPGSGLSECFPEAVRYVVGTDGRITVDRTEPLAADARSGKDGTRNALLKLAAGILDVGFDSLKQRDQERRTRQIAVASVVLAATVVVLAGLTYYAFVQKGAAEREARAARAALSGQVASHAQIALDTFPQRALLLAVQALRITEDKGDPPIPAVKEALRRALANTGGLVFGGQGAPIVAVDVSPDGRWLITVPDGDASARLWDLTAPDGAGGLELRGAGGPVAISADSRWLVTTGRGGDAARLWDLSARDPSASPRALEAAIGPVAFSRDTRWLVTGGTDKSVRLWDLGAPPPGGPAIVLPAQANEEIVVAISPDSRQLVTSSWEPAGNRPTFDVTRLWDLTTPRPETTGVELKGHRRSVSNAVFSPDGRWLATGSGEYASRRGRADPNVLLWDLKKATPSAITLAGHEGPITAMVMSRDGRWLATGSADRTARLWDLTAPAIDSASVVLPGHASTVTGIVIAPDSASVVTIDGRRNFRDPTSGFVARVWKLEAAAATVEPRVVTRDERLVSVSTFKTSDDGRRLLLVSGGTAFVLDLRRSDPTTALTVLRAHEDEITTAAFAGEGRSVVTAGKDKTARLWRLDPAGPSASPTLVRAELDQRYAISPDSRRLVTIGADNAEGRPDSIAVLWELSTENMASRAVLLRGHTGPVFGIAFSRDSRWLVTASNDTTARLWDMRAGDPTAAPRVLRGHGGAVSHATFTPDGRWLVTGSFDSTVRLWDVTRENPSDGPTVLRADGSVFGLAVSSDGRWLVVNGEGQATLWDLRATDPARASTLLKDSDRRVLLSPDGRWLLTYGSDEDRSLRARLATSQDPQERRELTQQQQRVTLIAAVLDLTAKDVSSTRRVLDQAGEPLGVSPDGRWLITRGQEIPRLWPLTGPDPAPAPIVLKEHAKSLEAAAFSADGRWLISGGYDGIARLWDLSAKDIGATSRVLSTHPISVGAVAISPDRRWLLAAGQDQARLWEPSADGAWPRPIVLPVGEARVGGAAFSADGDWLMTRSRDTRTLSVWPMKLDALVRLACRTAGRNLTAAEWEQYFPGQPYTKVCPGLGAG